MASVQVTKNEKDNHTVVSSATENRVPASEGFAERFAVGATNPAVATAVLLLLDTVVAAMLAAIDKLVRRDNALALEVGDDKGLSSELDAAVAEARDIVTGSRESIRGLLGVGVERQLGFEAETPYDPAALIRTGTIAAQGLGKLAPVKLRGFAFEPADLASELNGVVCKLEAAVKASVADGRENQAARAARNEALAEFVDVFQKGTNFIQAVLRAAGLQEAADRLRPTGRDPGTLAEPANPAA